MIKYKTGGYGKNLIKEVECERETEKSVWAKSEWNGKFERNLKETGYYRYHDTWEEAHKFLMEKAERKVESAERQIQSAYLNLQDVSDLKNKTGE